MTNSTELHATLWPSFPHFEETIKDQRVDGIRLNGPITFSLERIAEDVNHAVDLDLSKLYFDIKARQVRVIEVRPYKDHLELKVNHKIRAKKFPLTVLFKDGTDYATLVDIKDDVLIFEGGPKNEIVPCEPVYIRPPEFIIQDNIISDYEAKRIEIARDYGINHFMLSYVENENDIVDLREHIGNNASVVAKIESRKGLEYVANRFKKTDGLSLMLARGDLYVELDKPHEIIGATKSLIEKDPEAMVGSRILHSLRNTPIPECADFSELAWLYHLGYRRFLLCDELCLKKELLARSINVFDSFRRDCTPNYESYSNRGRFGSLVERFASKVLRPLSRIGGYNDR